MHSKSKSVLYSLQVLRSDLALLQKHYRPYLSLLHIGNVYFFTCTFLPGLYNGDIQTIIEVDMYVVMQCMLYIGALQSCFKKKLKTMSTKCFI